MSVVENMATLEYARQVEKGLAGVGIRCESFSDGTFSIKSAQTPKVVEDQVVSVCPTADIQLHAEGAGTQGTVRIAGPSAMNE